MESIALKTATQNLVTINKFASEKMVSRQTIYNWIKEGRVKQVEFLGKKFIDRSTFN